MAREAHDDPYQAGALRALEVLFGDGIVEQMADAGTGPDPGASGGEK